MKSIATGIVVTLLVLEVVASDLPNPPKVRFDDFKVYRVVVKSLNQWEALQKLPDNVPVHIMDEFDDPNRPVSIIVNPANQEKLVDELEFLELEHTLVMDDLQDTIDKIWPQTSQTDMSWTAYHDLDVIYRWLDKIAEKNKKKVTSYIIGYSYEGRPIKAVKLSYKKKRKAIFIESNIHAIELIASATSTCLIDKLLNSKNKKIKSLFQKYDWIFVPILNPDGFEYVHHVHPLWRKNRKPTGFSNSSGICYGVDLNRNFDFHWGVSGYNFDVPCDHWYGGAEPNAEPEVQALVKFVESFQPGYIRMYLALHSYGNLVLLPYGHTNEDFPPNYDQMLRIAKAFATGAKVSYGTEFRCGASGLLNYPVSGAAKDWAYGVQKIQFSATVELRDDGSKYGFFLPPDQILPVCTEVTDGLIAMVKRAEQEGLFR